MMMKNEKLAVKLFYKRFDGSEFDLILISKFDKRS